LEPKLQYLTTGPWIFGLVNFCRTIKAKRISRLSFAWDGLGRARVGQAFVMFESPSGPSRNNLYNLTGFFDGWRRCSLVTEPFGHAPRSRLASRQNSGVSL
jgi:hypothetical protein